MSRAVLSQVWNKVLKKNINMELVVTGDRWKRLVDSIQEEYKNKACDYNKKTFEEGKAFNKRPWPR